MSQEEIKNNITERDFWASYWTQYVPERIDKVLFEDIFERFPNGALDYIEVGGFPGTFSVYFKRKKNYNVYLLDYFILTDVVRKLEKINNIPENSIQLIEADFITYQSDKKYDVVQSAGFIEHFNDFKHIISQHEHLVKKGGILFISVPNLLGLNGLFQKIFDPENVKIHNLEAMKVEKLRAVCEDLGLKNIKVSYYGNPSIWVEQTSKSGKWIHKFVKIANKFLYFVPFRGKFFSPFIYLYAEKG